MEALLGVIAQDVETVVAKDPDDGEDDPDREEGVESELQGPESLLRLGVGGENGKAHVLPLHNREEQVVSDHVQKTTKGEPRDGPTSHLFPGVEVGGCASEQHAEDKDRACDLERRPNLLHEIVCQERAGKHVVSISVVAQANDQRPNVVVIVSHGVGGDFSEIANHREEVHVERDVVLLVVSRE
eukprot:3936772-Rhodomonas_salina.1